MKEFKLFSGAKNDGLPVELSLAKNLDSIAALLPNES
jgi:hypothetical protein